MNQSPVLMQSYFFDRALRQSRLLENIKEQSQQLQQIQSIDTTGGQDDPSGVAVKSIKLDFDLLRYACYFVERKFEEAARHDCARLIVESVLDPTGGEASGEHWRRWLSVAPCWPQLAIACWSSVLNEVPDLLIERLTASGLVIDREMNQGIEDLVSGLTIADVLPAELVAQFFTETKDDADTDEF